ncbi:MULTISPECIES: EamA family transporter [unclassified Clostridium]|uniref:EamA family transporter n=1 Tax=unclassified Clostridium TaxID=2614128 RepID=UPI000EEA09C2|nr:MULTISPECIES: EamA family transporter [unclassified Clostridium]HCQ89604.1 EamA family transporter [Clostridium sp.]
MWIVYSLLSAIFAALVAIFGKIGLAKLDANSATAIRAIVMAIFTTLIVFFQGKFSEVSKILEDKRALLFIIFSGMAGALSWIFYFTAIKTGKVAEVSVLDKTSAVMAAILAFLILGEKINKTSILGLALMTIGAILVVLK